MRGVANIPPDRKSTMSASEKDTGNTSHIYTSNISMLTTTTTITIIVMVTHAFKKKHAANMLS